MNSAVLRHFYRTSAYFSDNRAHLFVTRLYLHIAALAKMTWLTAQKVHLKTDLESMWPQQLYWFQRTDPDRNFSKTFRLRIKIHLLKIQAENNPWRLEEPNSCLLQGREFSKTEKIWNEIHIIMKSSKTSCHIVSKEA